MDHIIDALAAFGSSTSFDSLTPEVVHATIRNHLDAVGCGLGGLRSEPARILRSLAGEISGAAGASVFGLRTKSTVEMAAFANGTMVRYLDFNDMKPTKGGGHPSDGMSAIAALVEAKGQTGRDLIMGFNAVVEVFMAFAETVPLRDLGWDQGAFMAVATAVGASAVLRLDKEKVANAVALAITPSIPLRVTRTGQLSHWKACASPYAAMNGLFAARLAERGMTGPPEAFSGVDGFFAKISGEFTFKELGKPSDGLFGMQRTHFKYRPVEGTAQAILQAMASIKAPAVQLDDIEAITVRTYHEMWHEIGGGQGDASEKWDPRTRETADHSLPYLLAIALVDGDVTLDSFDGQRIADPLLRPIMRRISVEPDPEFSARWPQEHLTEIVVKLKSGTTIAEQVPALYRGHPSNPMTDEELDAKFRMQARRVLPDSQVDSLAGTLWALDQFEDLEEIFEPLRCAPCD